MNDDIIWKIDAEIEKDIRVSALELENQRLKEVLDNIPKVNSTISTYGSIDLDELNKTVERLNKIPNYDDLMKENNKLQSNWNSLREDIQHKKDILDKDQAYRFNHETKFKLDILNYVLDKMNELEGEDNE